MAGQPNAQADNQGEFRDELGSMQEAFPALADGLSGYLSALDGLPGIDRKTHELIRLACTVILRHGPAVRRHAMLAAEFGATWQEVLGTMVLTQPSFGLVPAREMLPFAQEGFEEGRQAISEE
ncbi:MAG: carboxymuconolactone decarboxylase family protein [Actinobacteria bacterium]|nr:carboxymuconolactone decarboxylase family protein [Actinomycetota bacterium]